MKGFKLNSLLFAASTTFALSGCGGTTATPNGKPPVVAPPEPLFPASAKHVIPHFEGGALTGRLHHLDLDTYYAILDYLEARGAEPSLRNVDAVYDAMKR